jgi:hypothetical protein
MCRTGIVPAGVSVRLGRKVKIDMDRMVDWISKGGQALPGEWRWQRDDEKSPS